MVKYSLHCNLNCFNLDIWVYLIMNYFIYTFILDNLNYLKMWGYFPFNLYNLILTVVFFSKDFIPLEY